MNTTLLAEKYSVTQDDILNFISNLVDYRQRLITLIVLSKYKALLASDVVNFIPNTTRSGLGKLLTLIGYISELPEMAESSLIKKE